MPVQVALQIEHGGQPGICPAQNLHLVIGFKVADQRYPRQNVEAQVLNKPKCRAQRLPRLLLG